MPDKEGKFKGIWIRAFPPELEAHFEKRLAERKKAQAWEREYRRWREKRGYNDRPNDV